MAEPDLGDYTVEGMLDSRTSQPATVYTPPECLVPATPVPTDSSEGEMVPGQQDGVSATAPARTATSRPPVSAHRDRQMQHIAATKAKLTDDDSLALFRAFLLGEVGPVLTRIIERRVDEATAELLEEKDRQYQQRLEDVRTELQRHVAAADRRAGVAAADAMWKFFLRLPSPTPMSDAVQREALRLRDASGAEVELALRDGERDELRSYRAEDLRQREWAAGLREADVRCLDCNLRYGERQQYSCSIEARSHSYDEEELAEARQLEEPTIPRGDRADPDG